MPTAPLRLRPNRLRAFAAISLLVLAGCAADPPPPVQVTTPAAEPDSGLIADLLEAATEAFEDDRLLTPPGDNAVEYLHRLAEQDPDNEDAMELTDRVVERYLEKATEAAAQGYFVRARSMLDRARIVNPAHPELTGVAATVEALAGAERERIYFDRHGVAARSSSVGQQLRAVGARAKQHNVRINIVARNDAEGRWMYQQMRQAPGERRVRAELAIGSPPSVEIIELACPSASC